MELNPPGALRATERESEYPLSPMHRESPTLADTRPAPQPLPEGKTDLHEAKGFGSPRPCLKVLLGPDHGKGFRLKQGNNVLGRGGHGFSDKEMSREHALIVLRGDEAILEDMGSINGTYVGIEKLSSPRRLHPGETFYLGMKTLVLFTHVDEEPIPQA